MKPRKRLDSSRSLRVGIVVPYDLSEAGGGVKHHAFELAAALRASGDHVTVFGPASAPIAREHVVGFPGVVNLASNGGENRMALFTPPWWVRSELRRQSFDVLHVHEPLVPAITYWSAWLSPGVPKVATFHAYAEDPPLQLRVGQRIWGSTVYPFFLRAIAVSEAAARYARIAWHDPLAIIANGVRTDVFTPGDEPRAHGAVRLLFVGKVSEPRKGFAYLLEAYRRLRGRGVPVALHVVGDRGRAEASQPIDGVVYHGAVGLAELVRLYRSSDVFVAPSTSQESFGIVLLEAMACARPIVCTAIDGYRDVVHPRGALLVPPRDAEALAEAIALLAADPDARRTMSAVNRRHAQRFSWTRIAPRVREVYVSAMGGTTSASAATEAVPTWDAE